MVSLLFLLLQWFILSLCSSNSWLKTLDLSLRPLKLNINHRLVLDSRHETKTIHSFMVTNEPGEVPTKGLKYYELLLLLQKEYVYINSNSNSKYGVILH